MEPLILHIETSSRLCSVALSRGDQPLASLDSGVVNDHSATLAPMISQVLEQIGSRVTDLEAIAVSIGPGSYTGLRVGLSTAKGMCFALGCPLISVDTLQSLAWSAMAVEPDNSYNIYVSVLDARRQDAYMSVFRRDGTRLEESRFLTVTPGCLDYLSGKGNILICGEGTDKWEQLTGLPGISTRPMECHALHLISSATTAYRAGEFAELTSVVPAYLKPPNITIPA